MPRRRLPDRFTSRWRDRVERVPTPPSSHARMVQENNFFTVDEIQPEEYERLHGINLPAGARFHTHEGREWVSQGDGTATPVKSITIPPTPATREVTVEFDESSVRIQARATQRPQGYWKLRNGKFIAISEMDDEHLENCIRMCERNSQTRGRRADPTSAGVYSELFDERARRRRRLEEHAEVLRIQLAQEEYQRSQPSPRQVRWFSEEGNRGLVGRSVWQGSSPNPTPSDQVLGIAPTQLDQALGSAPSYYGGVLEPEKPESIPNSIPEGAPKRRIKS